MAAITGSNVEALAKKSQNPVAKLISVPFEYNFNGEFGPNNGKQAINGRMAYCGWFPKTAHSWRITHYIAIDAGEQADPFTA